MVQTESEGVARSPLEVTPATPSADSSRVAGETSATWRSWAVEWAGVRRHGMPAWKWLAMHGYYQLTRPQRHRMASQLIGAGRAPAIVLLFHRVACDWANEWTTHTDVFVQAIRWLKKNFELVALSEAQRRVAASENRRPCVAITFDDGYAENCQVALPLLIEEQIPCTYFVTTRHILNGESFEHDVAMGNRFPPNSVEQLQRVAAGGIEIGAHTRNHADMGSVHDPEAIYDEIVTSRDELQQALGLPLSWFAFPFGRHENLSRAAILAARDAGYQGICSAYGGYNFPGDDPFHMQRIGVDGPLIRVKNWTLLDRYKQLRMPRFEYQSADDHSERNPEPQTVGA